MIEAVEAYDKRSGRQLLVGYGDGYEGGLGQATLLLREWLYRNPHRKAKEFGFRLEEGG